MSATTVCRDISALTETAEKACKMFLAECERRGLNVLITETYRSQARQNYLYAQGRTRAGKKVTWTLNSRHTSRRAWDICKNEKGAEYSDSGFFNACGDVAAELGITWGGNWKTPDTPHFEIGEDWKPKGENDEMTIEEKEKMESLEKRIAELEGSKERVYHYFSELPEYAYDTIKELWDKGIYKGNSAEDLNLPESLMRSIIICERVRKNMG